MNYPESSKILALVKKSKRILINCHTNPDIDSIGSALAMYDVLKTMGKQAELVSTNKIPQSTKFLHNSNQIQIVDYSKMNFSDYDLFITLDSADWKRVVGRRLAEKIQIPDIPLVVIDHHVSNPGYGQVNLIVSDASSTAEIVFLIFEDWKVKINQKVASALLGGIIGDTGVFQYPGANEVTFSIANKLMNIGADKDEIIHHIYRSTSFNLIKFWGEAISSLTIDKKHRFVWIAIPYQIYSAYSKLEEARETAASNFTQIIKGTDFGMVMIEEEKGNLSVSFRSRTGFDVSKIATDLGGGGHKAAAGCKIIGVEFDEGVDKVLQVVRKHAKKS